MAKVSPLETKQPQWTLLLTHRTVFDVSQYLEDHPGGAELLKEAAGTDATEAFDNAGHSEDALEIMRELCIGVLKGYKKPAPKRSVQVPRVAEASAKTQTSSASPSAKTLTAATGVAAILCSAAYYSRHTSILRVPKELPAAHHLPRLGITGGFPAGFLAASAITALLAAAAAHQLSKLTQLHSGFTRYPPHKPSTKLRRHTPPPAPKSTPFLNPQTYQRLPLISKQTLCRGVLRLVFALPTPSTTLGLPTGQHVSIRATIDGKSVSRSYTPVSNDADKGVLELVIRVYPDGVLTSCYLANLRAGVDEVEFRGPKGAMKYARGWAKKIGMVAGGTGITPMYQVIRAICEDEEDETEVSLVYANRGEEDILLREELEALAERYPGKLKVWYMLDLPPEGWAYGAGFVTGSVLRERMPSPGEGSKVMLCGPPGMVNAAKGMLVEMGYKAPGAMGKMEDDIFVF
jgi:cytochrome-b5 reductase